MSRPLLNLPSAPYDPEAAAYICDQLSEGVLLSHILRDWPADTLGEAPPRRAVYAWRESNEDFGKAFDASRDIGYDVIAETTFDISEDGSADWEKRRNRAGEEYEVVNPEAVARSKLRVYTREKMLAVWSPRYRPQQGIQLSNPEGGPVEFTETTRSARVASLLALANARKNDPEPEDGSDLV